MHKAVGTISFTHTASEFKTKFILM